MKSNLSNTLIKVILWLMERHIEASTHLENKIMTPDTTRPSPFFIADNRALDFLNSVAAPWGSEIEWLGDGFNLLDWLKHAELIPNSVLIQFREQTSQEELNKIAEQTRELREWFRKFVSTHAGQPLDADVLIELEPINRLLAKNNGYHQIGPGQLDSDPDRSALHWQQNRRWLTPDMLLMPLAEAIGHLICHANFTRLRNCEGPTCTLWFLDISKNHTRRWCTMAICGNRAKATAHREKKRAANTKSKR